MSKSIVESLLLWEVYQGDTLEKWTSPCSCHRSQSLLPGQLLFSFRMKDLVIPAHRLQWCALMMFLNPNVLTYAFLRLEALSFNIEISAMELGAPMFQNISCIYKLRGYFWMLLFLFLNITFHRALNRLLSIMRGNFSLQFYSVMVEIYGPKCVYVCNGAGSDDMDLLLLMSKHCRTWRKFGSFAPLMEDSVWPLRAALVNDPSWHQG